LITIMHDKEGQLLYHFPPYKSVSSKVSQITEEEGFHLEEGMVPVHLPSAS